MASITDKTSHIRLGGSLISSKNVFRLNSEQLVYEIKQQSGCFVFGPPSLVVHYGLRFTKPKVVSREPFCGLAVPYSDRRLEIFQQRIYCLSMVKNQNK